MLSLRETSYYTLLTTIEEYMSLVDINPTPSAETSMSWYPMAYLGCPDSGSPLPSQPYTKEADPHHTSPPSVPGLAEASAATNPTPEKLAFWTSRLESAAQLRRDCATDPCTTPRRLAVPSSDDSGDEKWHTPGIHAKSLGLDLGPGVAPKQEEERGVGSPQTLIRAIHDCMDSLSTQEWAGEGAPLS